MMSEFKKHFFNHDFYASQDDKIQKLYISLGGEGYGFYWMIIEHLYSNDGEIPEDYKKLEYIFRCNGKANLLERIVNDFDLFEVIDGNITSNRVLVQLDNIKYKSEESRKAVNIRHENNVRKQLIRHKKKLAKDDEQMAEFRSMLDDSNDNFFNRTIIPATEKRLIGKRKTVLYKKFIDEIKDEVANTIQQRKSHKNTVFNNL